VSGDLSSIFVLSLLAMFTPTLLAAVTVMLLLPNPKKLMIGYLLGAYLTSISLGLLIVFELDGSAAVNTSKNTLGPGEDLILGALLLAIAFVLGSGRAEPLRERRRRRKEQKKAEAEGKAKESLPERMIGRGDPRLTFVAGVLLTLPGVSYLTALSRIAKLEASSVEVVVLVVTFCLIQLLLIELPLLGYAFAPDWTKDTVTRFRNWLSRNGRQAAVVGASAIGGLLILRGIIELIAQ
jgi:hypothetical protein